MSNAPYVVMESKPSQGFRFRVHTTNHGRPDWTFYVRDDRLVLHIPDDPKKVHAGDDAPETTSFTWNEIRSLCESAKGQ